MTSAHAAHPHAAHPHAAPPAAAQHQHDHEPGAGSLAEILDLDAEVLAGHLETITGWLPADVSPRSVVDLGCGTGAGTFALLARFPQASVTAVDASAAHLQRLQERADAAGVAERVHTLLADLDADWPDLGRPGLVWASASLHHLADPDRALRAVHDLLPTSGVLVVVELAGFPRFLPEDAPQERPGLEERCHAALARRHAEQLPHRGADWGPRLTAAGFTVEDARTVEVNVPGSADEAVGRYAVAGLQRLRAGAAEVLDVEDLATLDQLVDASSPGSLLRRDDLAVRTERTVWIAHRG